MRISVLIPCYNAGAFVGEAIDSALSQSHAAHEVLVVDDGSTDDSAEVAEGYGERVRLIRQPNGGIGAARNRALAEATGDWIAFLDADDVWPHHSLGARATAIAVDPTLDCVAGLTEEFFNTDEVGALVAPAKAAATLARVAGATLIRKALFDRVGDFDATLKVGETMDWIARASDAGARMATVETVVLRRRIHGANTVLRERGAQGDYLKVLRASLARRAAARDS